MSVRRILPFCSIFPLLLMWHLASAQEPDGMQPESNGALAALASDAMQPYQEYDKKIKAAELVPALTSDLFGEAVSLYDQTVAFHHVDVDIPGSNGLPVRLSRSLTVRPVPFYGTPPEVYGGAGDWDVDVPRISGVFDSMYGWNISYGGNAPRCSSSFFPRTDPPHDISEIWSGYVLSIPGQGSRSLVGLPPDQFKKPDSKTRLWTTTALDAVSCTPMIWGYPGEGFVVETTAGLVYTFNVGTQRSAGKMGRDNAGPASRLRLEVSLLASRVEDRFGNWVEYSYNSAGHPVSISSSDGRLISLTYSDGRLSGATAHGQSWSYAYNGSTLQRVTLPDQSYWEFTHSSDRRIRYERWTEDPGVGCGTTAPLALKNYTLQLRHPSGALGEFEFVHQRLYRAGIPSTYCEAETVGGTSIVHRLALPNYFDVLGLSTKRITGPGIPAGQLWSYFDLGSYQGLWSGMIPPCMTCTQSKRVRIVQPDGSRVEEEFGIVFSHNEGRLLSKRHVSGTGTTLRSEYLSYVSNAEAASAPFPDRYGSLWGGNDESSVLVRPLRRRETIENGFGFIWEATAFDAFARPVNVTQSSAPSP